MNNRGWETATVMSVIKNAAFAATIGLLGLGLAPVASAQNAKPGVLVAGDNLPANVDPHQIFDVPMQMYSLNAYDNLYRYEGNPPKLEPWLAESHTVSADGHDGNPTRIGQERYLISMFVDMRGSTRMAEKRLPIDTGFIVNRFLGPVAQAVL